MHQLVFYAGLVACAGVLLACVCRIDLMRSGVTSWAWFLVYALFAVYALGTGIQTYRAGWFDWNDAAGIGGILLHVFATWHQWTDGPPPESIKGALE